MRREPQRASWRRALVAGLAISMTMAGSSDGADKQESRDCRVPSKDGVEIAFTARGTGDVALLLIHGGGADRSFWKPQMEQLGESFFLVALDLGGHGESERERTEWRIASWAEDVRAVADELQLDRVVLVGNSLGAPVALEAARLLSGRVLGVIAVDTLHELARPTDPDAMRERARAYREDFSGACHAMVEILFHQGQQAELRAWVEGRMCATPAEIVASMTEGAAELDLVALARAARVPIRAINGDLWPTNVEGNRSVVSDFDATIMEGAGHYPMLERPEEFNRLLVETVRELEKRAAVSQ